MCLEKKVVLLCPRDVASPRQSSLFGEHLPLSFAFSTPSSFTLRRPCRTDNRCPLLSICMSNSMRSATPYKPSSRRHPLYVPCTPKVGAPPVCLPCTPYVYDSHLLICRSRADSPSSICKGACELSRRPLLVAWRSAMSPLLPASSASSLRKECAGKNQRNISWWLTCGDHGYM